MGNNTRQTTNGTSQLPPEYNEEEVNKWRNDLINSSFGLSLGEEYCNQLVDTIISNGFKIEKVRERSDMFKDELVISPMDENIHDYFEIVLPSLETMQHENYSMDYMLKTYNGLQDFYKSHSGRHKITIMDNESGGMTIGGEIVSVGIDTMAKAPYDQFGFESVLRHELTHRLDHEYGSRRYDAYAQGIETNPIFSKPENKRTLSDFPKFVELGKRESSSAYSRRWKYLSTGELAGREFSTRYNSENLSELMSVTNLYKKYGENVMVQDPRQNNKDIKIPYKEWANINKGLADLGNQLYDAKDYDEFKRILME